MKLTKEWLTAHGACAKGVAWFNAQDESDGTAVVEKLIAEGKLIWANWLIVRLLDRPGWIRYAVYAAEQVLPIFEQRQPADDRPRKAIAAARAVLANNTKNTRNAAAHATYAAHDTFAFDAASAASAASAAAYASDATAYASDATAFAFDAAAYASAASDADAAPSARNAMLVKIVRYGIELTEGVVNGR